MRFYYSIPKPAKQCVSFLFFVLLRTHVNCDLVKKRTCKNHHSIECYYDTNMFQFHISEMFNAYCTSCDKAIDLC